jgi:alkaline phosphatase D
MLDDNGLDRCRFSRRDFLRVGGGAFGAIALGTLPAWRSDARHRFRKDPFTLGIASGDPSSTGAVLWTRLAPADRPPDGRVPVDWEIALDDGFRRIARRGSALAVPELAHSVHVELDGLEPARSYWYRFTAGDVTSAVGHLRTAPAGDVDRVRFAFVSCQNYQDGLYTAFEHLAAEEVDVVVHLGDYIYENGPAENRPRRHDAPEIVTLDDYRRRYALYKGDAMLQAVHARHAFVTTWDDHEVDNNYAASIAEERAPVSGDAFLQRRAAAYQAYYEHMPLRRTMMPSGPDLRLYRRLDYGRLLRFHVLDTRQYRTDQPCGDGFRASCSAAADPSATILGDAQERWLLEGLSESPAGWNVLANQVPVSPVYSIRDGERAVSMDKWSAYLASRRRLIDAMHARPSLNPVVITGDVHVSWVADVKTDFENAASNTVATELVGTSISSGGDGQAMSPGGEALLATNPHVSFFNGHRGYVRCDVTRERLHADYRTLPYVTRPGAPIATAASFVTEAGRPGAQRDG